MTPDQRARRFVAQKLNDAVEEPNPELSATIQKRDALDRERRRLEWREPDSPRLAELPGEIEALNREIDDLIEADTLAFARRYFPKKDH